MSSRRLFSTTAIKRERVLLVAGILPDDDDTAWRESLNELKELVSTASGEVVGEIFQRIPHPGQTGYLGKGKLEEIAAMVKEQGIDLLAFDNDLKPSQAKAVEEVVGCRVVDRTEVILAIFALHAQTNEARVQVEIAQLEYSAPRQKHRWSHLWRQTGGYSIGTRGPGEKQLEVDRRANRKRVMDLRGELAVIQAHRDRVVSSRPNGFTISIVGYTNSGKSSTLNALTDAGVLVRDQMFSTLDTRTRLLVLDNGLKVLMSDTVGFIRKLPSNLVASFRSTLTETRSARFLMHIVDASAKNTSVRIDAVEDVLSSIGCEDKRTLLVFNKVDVISDYDAEQIRARFPGAVLISAMTGKGIAALKEAISELILSESVRSRVALPLKRQVVIDELMNSGYVTAVEFGAEEAVFDIRIPVDELGKLLHRGAREVV